MLVMILLFVLFVFLLLCFISMLMLLVMKSCVISGIKFRKLLVIVYKICIKLAYIFLLLVIILSVLFILKIIYNFTYITTYGISNNKNISQYLALTLSLIFSEILIFSILKILKKKIFKESTKHEEFKRLQIDFVNKIILIINKIPIKGIIHLINLVLVFYANISNILSLEVDITINVIYMSVATYYAFDKVLEYFIKKYSTLWDIGFYRICLRSTDNSLNRIVSKCGF